MSARPTWTAVDTGQDSWRAVPGAAAGRWEWDLTTGLVRLDEVAEALLEVRPGEPVADACHRALSPADLARLDASVRVEAELSVIARLSGGSERVLLVRTTHAATVPDQRAGLLLDVSALDAGHAAGSVLLQSSPDAFAAVDPQLRITAVNARACQEAGRGAVDLLGRHLGELIEDGDGTAALAGLVHTALASGRAAHLDSHVSPAGRACRVHVVPTGGGAGIWWRDVDDHVRATAASEQALVSERRARRAAEEARAALSRQASSDALTGLANRAELTRRLGGHLGRDGHAATVLFIDLDKFKEVNDSLGHAAGDELLSTVSSRLRQLVRASDVVARIGGDEFVVALLDEDSPVAATAAEDVAHRVLAALREPVRLRGQLVLASASIGVAVGGPHTDTEALLHDADVALYRTKRSGRDGITWYDDELRRQVVDRQQLEADLSRAPEAGELALDYQACFDLRTGAVVGVEALLRWHHPVRGRVAAAQAVELAEATGLIVPVGSWVLDTAVADAARWAEHETVTTWVNVSAQQLVREGFADDLLIRLAKADVPPWRFGVEVTETALADGGPAEEEVARLSASGIRVAVDDFGTGFSSLARLARFPVDVLKIDRTFVEGVRTQRGTAVVRGVVTLGHAIGARVVAEGVETAEEVAHLRDAGCDGALGYLLARPVPAEQVPMGSAPASLLP